MPLVSVSPASPFIDRRQSRRALTIRTGVERHFGALGWATLPEVTLACGRRADLMALSPKGEVAIVEIKSSLADLRADTKWPDYRAHCDALTFATLADVPRDAFPEETGLMLADGYGAETLREAPRHPLSAHRRKALHLRFARAAAMRLQRCCDHAGVDGGRFAEAADG